MSGSHSAASENHLLFTKPSVLMNCSKEAQGTRFRTSFFSTAPFAMKTLTQKRGFSLIELLVVMAVIGILVSLLLPAVQGAREAARRLQCRNNLKQLSLAVINYEGAHKCYPPAGLVGPRIQDYMEGPFNPRSGQMLSWVVLVLPFMEEQALYQQFDLARSALDQTNEPQATAIKAMFCPSDEAEGRFFSDPSLTGGKRFAKGNYAAFISPYHLSYADWWPSGLSGVHRYAIKDVVDGTSNTLLLSEVRTRDNEQDQRGAWALPWCASSVLAFDMHAINDSSLILPLSRSYLVNGLPYRANYIPGESQTPNYIGSNFDMLYSCPDAAGSQLDGMPCGEYQHNYTWGWLSAAPRSRHAGGVNAAFSDGRIAFLSDSIDVVTMAYLVSSNDGQAAELSQAR
jgi:prepilin-type N-terminal cleavage/methylation domain-containing protein/prepilin-type processing-associated H-X9-DG protein